MKFNLTITDMSDEEFASVFKAVHTPKAVEKVVEVEEPVMSEIDTPEYDKDGLKWDARIHSSNHQMTAKGVWQRRRGVSDEEFNAVRNELLGLEPSNESVTTFVEPNAPISTPVVEPHVIPMTVPPVVAPAPLAVEPSPTPVVAPDATVSPDIMFQTMFKKLQAGLGNNTLKGNDIKNLLDSTNAQFGLQCQNLTQFKDNISAIQFIINELTIRGL